MPKIELWSNFPSTLRQHLIGRMRDRSITLADLNRLRLWIESNPESQTTNGTRILDRSSSAEKGDIRKLSCCLASRLEEQSYSRAEKFFYLSSERSRNLW
jgi:hypothetical protein